MIGYSDTVCSLLLTMTLFQIPSNGVIVKDIETVKVVKYRANDVSC